MQQIGNEYPAILLMLSDHKTGCRNGSADGEKKWPAKGKFEVFPVQILI